MRPHLSRISSLHAFLRASLFFILASTIAASISGAGRCGIATECSTCSTNIACAWIPHYNHTIANDQYGTCTSLSSSQSSSVQGIVTFNSTQRCPLSINVTTPAAGQMILFETWVNLIYYVSNVSHVSLITTFYDKYVPNKIVSRSIIFENIMVTDGWNERKMWFEPLGPASVNMTLEVVTPVPDVSPLTGPYIAYGRSSVGSFSSCAAQFCQSCIEILPFTPSMPSAFSCSWDAITSSCRTLQDVQSNSLPSGIRQISGCLTIHLNQTISRSSSGQNEYYLNESVVFQIYVADSTLLSFELDLVNSTDGSRLSLFASGGTASNSLGDIHSFDYQLSKTYMPPAGSSALSWRIPTSLPAGTYHLLINVSSEGGTQLSASSDDFALLQIAPPTSTPVQLQTNASLSSGAIAGISIAGAGSLIAIGFCIRASNQAAASGRSESVMREQGPAVRRGQHISLQPIALDPPPNRHHPQQHEATSLALAISLHNRGPPCQPEAGARIDELSEEPGLPAYEAAIGHQVQNYGDEGQIRFHLGEGEPY